MTRRAPGTGTVYYDAGRDRWRGELNVGRDPRSGRLRKLKCSGSDEATCTAELDKLVLQYKDTGEAPRRDTTVGQLLRDALDNPPPTAKSPKTLHTHEDLGKLIMAGLGHKPAVELTPRQVEQFLKAMARNGYATKTIAMAQSLLKRSLARGQFDGLLSRNVADTSIVPTPRGSYRKSKAMTEEQVNALLASGLSAWWRAWVLIGSTVGLRPGELLALGWDDIDLDTGMFLVRFALHDDKDEHGHSILVRAELKTERSQRTLWLDSPEDLDKVRAALAALRREQAANRLRLGPHYQESGVIFCTNTGAAYWHQNVNARFKVRCEKAGIGSDWQSRELRHTFASLSEMTIEEVSAAMGHASIRITDQVYRHVMPGKITRIRRTG